MNAPSQFDPNVFLDATTTEVNEKRSPIPTENPDDANGLYTAVIGEIKTAAGIIGKGDRVGQPWMQMVVPLRLQLPASVQALGLSAEFTVTDRPMLDITPQGSLDNGKGKNNAQRIYREATGTNKPGEAWSWRMLQGKVVKVKIAHEDYRGSIVEKVAGVFAA
jgi:hypothetical protein